MSMRIHNDAIATAAASQASPAESASPPGAPARAGSAAGSGTDQVDISSFAGNVAASISALAAEQAARVSDLAAIYAKGQYQVDSTQLSRALVSRALDGGSVEGDN
jgi:anti-sigma28 factor (negative regulator of flagellin synthesis)